MEFKDFNFEQYTNHYKQEIEKIVVQKINDFKRENPDKTPYEIDSYVNYHYMQISLDTAINVLAEYHKHLIEYLESKGL